jgi:hypothetical protein
VENKTDLVARRLEIGERWFAREIIFENIS